MSKVIHTAYGKIEFTRKGKGQPILFLHGGHSNCNETLFHEGYDLNSYQIITPSRPGYGRTPLGGNSQPKDAAKLLCSLVEELELEEVIIVGVSAGGLTAIELTRQLKQAAYKLVLISAVTKKWLKKEDPLYNKGKRLFSPRVEKLSWALFRLFFSVLPKKMTQVLFNEVSKKSNHKTTNDEVAEIKKMISCQQSGHGFIADLDQDIDVKALNDISCPTLILHSKNDNSVNIEMAYHAKTHIKDALLKEFDNDWGHLLWVGKDKVLPIEVTNSFLKEH